MPLWVLDGCNAPFRQHRCFSPQGILSISGAIHQWTGGNPIQEYCIAGRRCRAIPLMPPSPGWMSGVCGQSESYDTDTSAPEKPSKPEKAHACRRILCRISWSRWNAASLCLPDSRRLSHRGRTYAITLCCGRHPWLSQDRNAVPNKLYPYWLQHPYTWISRVHDACFSDVPKPFWRLVNTWLKAAARSIYYRCNPWLRFHPRPSRLRQTGDRNQGIYIDAYHHVGHSFLRAGNGTICTFFIHIKQLSLAQIYWYSGNRNVFSLLFCN